MKRHVWIVRSLFTMILTLSAASTSTARPKGDTWEVRETPIPSQRVGFATSVVDGKIFVIGGTIWDDGARRGRVLRTVEEYDPATNRWKFRADMRIGRSNLASSAVNGKIYAIGGSVQMLWTRKHVEEFDPATDTWEKKADMLEPRSNFSSNVVDGKIYVSGESPKPTIRSQIAGSKRRRCQNRGGGMLQVLWMGRFMRSGEISGGIPTGTCRQSKSTIPSRTHGKRERICQRQDVVCLRIQSMGSFMRLAAVMKVVS